MDFGEVGIENIVWIIPVPDMAQWRAPTQTAVETSGFMTAWEISCLAAAHSDVLWQWAAALR